MMTLALLLLPITSMERVDAHLLIGDCRSAKMEVEENHLSCACKIKVFSAMGDERAILSILPDAGDECLEDAAWGVIRAGTKSSFPLTRLLSLLASALTQDVRGIEFLEKGLEDHSESIRWASIELAGQFRDQPLRDGVMKRLKEESAWGVRLAAISAVGKMGIQSAKSDLNQILLSSNGGMEEQLAAIHSILLLDKKIDVEPLLKSPRRALRLLGVKVIGSPEYDLDPDLLIPLFNDPHYVIRQAAIRSSFLKGGVPPLLNDSHPEVAITSAWASDPKALLPYLKDERKSVRRLAAAALAASGERGLDLMESELSKSSDQFVSATLAYSLIGHRRSTEKSAKVIKALIADTQHAIMWQEVGGFRFLSPYKQTVGLPQERVLQDHNTKLELIYALHCIEDAEATSVMRSYLGSRTLPSAQSALLLLTEASGDPAELVEPLLNDENPQVAVQAAVVYAMWSQEEEVIHRLHRHYETADYELKQRILEALGSIGSPISIPFLKAALQESTQQLRIIAAWSLLACLNH